MTSEPRREELLDLALGLLEPEQARALEAHAEGCAACRAPSKDSHIRAS